MKYLIMKIKSYEKPLLKMFFEAQYISQDIFRDFNAYDINTYSLYNVKIKDIVPYSKDILDYVAVEDNHLRLYSVLSIASKTGLDVHSGDQYDKLIYTVPKMLLDNHAINIEIFDNDEKSAQLYYESED